MPWSINLRRIIKYGSLNLWRNRWLSATAITVMAITLLIVSSLLLLNRLSDISVANLKNRVDMSVFLTDDVPTGKIAEVKKEFESYEEIKEVRFISSDEALENFKKANQDNPDILKSLKEFDKSPFPASLVIKAKELQGYPVVYEKLLRSRFQPVMKTINYKDSKETISRLERITSGARTFGIALTLVFGFIAALVIFNTLRLTIFSRREEIEIMRLVGASNWYIRGPFVFEGIFYGIVATAIASVLLAIMLKLMNPSFTRFFLFDILESGFFNRGFWQVVFVQALIGTGLGVISSLVATRKHLQV